MNLLYDDGERENKVPLSLVRMQGRYDAPKPAESDDSDSDSDATHGFPRHSGRVYHGSRKGSDRGDGWEVRGRIVHALQYQVTPARCAPCISYTSRDEPQNFVSQSY